METKNYDHICIIPTNQIQNIVLFFYKNLLDVKNVWLLYVIYDLLWQ